MRASNRSNAWRRNLFGMLALGPLLVSTNAFSKTHPAVPAPPAKLEEKANPELPAVDKEPEPMAGAEAPVAAEPKADQAPGTLVVQLAGKESANLMLDGKDVGPLPFSGDVAAGVHDIYASGPHGISASRKVVITASGRNEIELKLVENPAKVRVTAADARAVIRIDGTPYGSGQIQTEVLPGKHRVSIEQPGYVPSVYEWELAPGEFKALDHVELERSALPHSTNPGQSKQGIYSMVALDGLIGKATNSLAANCPASGLGGTCSSGPTFGGELDVHVGYSFGTFGAEAFILGGTNFTPANLELPRDVTVEQSAWYGIARKERYFLFEPIFGGGAAGRVSTQGKSFKLSTAIGLGVAYRFVQVHRKIEAEVIANSSTIVRKDEKSGFIGGEGKTVPLFIWDSEIQLGPTPGTRIFLGIHSQIELGSEPKVTPASSSLGFEGSTGNPLALGAGPIDLRHSPAFYIGPRFGVVTGT